MLFFGRKKHRHQLLNYVLSHQLGFLYLEKPRVVHPMVFFENHPPIKANVPNGAHLLLKLKSHSTENQIPRH